MDTKVTPKESSILISIKLNLEKSLPPVFARRAIPKLFGDSLTVGTLANLGKNGPPFVRQGRHAVYERESFLAWYLTTLKCEG